MRRHYIIWFVITLVLVLACTRDREPSPVLGITIEFPRPSDTKADVGEVPATNNENKIYDLTIWVFNHETQEAVAKFATDSDFPEGGGVRKYSMEVPTTFAHAKPNVDVFVMVNAGSIGFNRSRTSWTAVHEAFFSGDDYFSPAPDKLRKTVPSYGLPMSGVGINLDITGEEPSFTLPTVSVCRAVSKLRYVFCQMETVNNTEETFAVDSVVLGGNQIPVAQYVFSENNECRIVTTDTPSVYDPRSIKTVWPSGTALAMNDTPEAFSYAGQDGPTYETMINDGVSSGKLTNLGTIYLRESDKALTGTVYYTITKKGQEGEKDQAIHKEMPFSMKDPGDFARNHTWTLYGYFISNRTLQLGVTALPWDKNNYTIRFDQSTLQVTQKFTVDPASATVRQIGDSKEYNVYLDPNKPARGYIYVTTPQGGTLQIIPSGDAADVAAFVVKPENATIDPTYNSGRIDITIDRKESGVTGKTITLSFEAYTPDERKIAGASECVDQIYHFHL